MENVKPKNEITDATLARVKELEHKGQITLPSDYSAENALKSAYLILQGTETKGGQSVLQACDKISIANSLLDMVVQGLNPAKKQCYFIPYGNKLTLMRSYFGTVAVAKSFGEIEDVTAQVILKGDEFKFEIRQGRKVVTKHEQTFDSMCKKEIVGAYATIIFKDGKEESVIMTLEEIKKSWSQNRQGISTVHNKFPEEMAKRTVINRLLKPYINSQKDTNLVLKEALDRTEEDRADAEVKEEIKEKANKEEIDVVIDADYHDVEDAIVEVTEELETKETQEEIIDINEIDTNNNEVKPEF